MGINKPKILAIDIETLFTTIGTFGLHNQNHGVEQILEDGGVICWGAKWIGEKKIMSDAVWNYGKDSEKAIAISMHKLMSQADIVCGHNAEGFDIKWLNKLFLKYKLEPIELYKVIDTFTICKRQFYFISYSLKNIARELELKHQKLDTGGFKLWKDCKNGIKKAQATMIKYNKGDVLVLEDLYVKLRPYIKNHPNMNLYSNKDRVCINCGSTRLKSRGLMHLITGTYRRLVCLGCGKSMRETKRVNHAPITEVR